jgi:glycosyltransferase involved in cell wall biosynthesis
MNDRSRRLLAVNWEMPPLSGPRAVQVSQTLNALVPLGWESSVICFGPRSNRYGQDHALAARLQADGVTRLPVASPEERFAFRALWRIVPRLKIMPDEKWVWIRAAVRAARRAASERRFDVLVSFAQPWSDHLIGLKLRRLLELPWVAHFSDPWVDSPYPPYSTAPAWQRRLWRRMEADVVREADAVVFVNRQTADQVMLKYPPAWRSKVAIVPHGHDGATPVASNGPRGGPLRIVYTGRFYEGYRTPAALLRALGRLSRTRPLARELKVIFAGTIIPAYVDLAHALALDDVVEFVPRLPREASMALAAGGDVLLVIDAPGDNNLFLPSKLIEYLPLHKPILGLTPRRGATADVLTELSYPIAPPDDEQAIASAVESLLAQHEGGTLAPSAQHGTVSRRYEISCTARAFNDVLLACARR